MGDIKQLADEFLALLRGDAARTDDALSRLERVLDALAFARHAVEFSFDDREHPEPPDWPYVERRALAVARFPALGPYNAVDPITADVGVGTPVVGDAHDDVADIAGDLDAFVWRWENNGAADALWHLQHTYEHHWGQHLRALQAYLFARRKGW